MPFGFISVPGTPLILMATQYRIKNFGTKMHVSFFPSEKTERTRRAKARLHFHEAGFRF
jgi:hypothetical protein